MKNKSKKITFITLITIPILFLILGIGLSIPGLGLQTQSFINDIKSQIKKRIPPNTVLLNYTHSDATLSPLGTGITLQESLKDSYENDALSSLMPDQFNDKNIYDTYKTFADSSFENDLPKLEKTTNDGQTYIDMYDFAMNLFNFDLSIASTNGLHLNTVNSGFVTTGLKWYSNEGLKYLLGNDSSAKETAKLYSQKISDDDVVQYANPIQLDSYYSSDSSSSNDVLAAPEDYSEIYDANAEDNIISTVADTNQIIENKIWFANEQFRSLILLNTINTKLFIDSNSAGNVISSLGDGTINTGLTSVTVNLNNPIKSSSLKSVNYMNWYRLSETGAIFLVILFPIIIMFSSALGIYFYLKWYKNNEIKLEKNKFMIFKKNTTKLNIKK